MTRAENPATAHGAGDAPAESERRRNAAPASLAPPAAHSVRRPAPWRAVLSYWLLRYRQITQRGKERGDHGGGPDPAVAQQPGGGHRPPRSGPSAAGRAVLPPLRAMSGRGLG